MGFCMGGWLTWELAYRDDRLDAAVAVLRLRRGERPRAAVPRCRCTSARRIRFEPAALDSIGETLRARGDGSELFVYEGAPTRS